MAGSSRQAQNRSHDGFRLGTQLHDRRMNTAFERGVLPVPSRATRMPLAFMGLAMTLPAMAAPPTFVGSELPPRPSDCSVAVGAVLGDPNAPNHLAYEHLKCGDRDLVLLLRFIEHREGKPHFVVVDEVEPLVTPWQRLLDTLTCSPVTEGGGDVIAVGTLSRVTERKLVAYDLTFAWRFDLSAEKIQPIAPTEVSCQWINVD